MPWVACVAEAESETPGPSACCLHSYPCWTDKQEAWEEKSLPRAFSLVSGRSRILTEICFTHLQMYSMDFDFAGARLVTLHAAGGRRGETPLCLHSCFSGFLPPTEAAAGCLC